MKSSRAFTLLFVLLTPVLFSMTFARLYNQDIFQFFTGPTVDDEGYFDHLNVWFGNHVYSAVPALRCRVPRNWRGIGSAVLWSPGYLAFKWAGLFLRPRLGMEAVDTDQWLRLGAATTNFLIASTILGLVLSILLLYVRPPTALLFSAIAVFGGLLPYYLFRRPLMSHGAETLFFLLGIYGIEKIKRAPDRLWYFGWVGLACAGVLSARFQQLPAVALLLIILSWDQRRRWKRVVVLIAFFAAGLMPQLMINRFGLGSWVSPPSQALSFLTPAFLVQVGPVQLTRMVRLFFGGDWGLFLMFPWLAFAFFIAREKFRALWPVSRAWLLAPLPALLIQANWIAHGGSYGQRYVTLVVLAAVFLAADGFESLLEMCKSWRPLAYAALALAFFISLAHFVAFESDESRLTLHLGPVTEEGPVRPEWLREIPDDYVNGRFSLNAYSLFLHPADLIRRFGAAPLPLFAAVEIAQVRQTALNPAIELYIVRHHINLRSYWRYIGMVAAVNMVLLLLFISWTNVFGQEETTCPPR